MLNESASIKTAALNLDENFSKSPVSIILEGKRKIVTGIGKSGHQAKRELLQLLAAQEHPLHFFIHRKLYTEIWVYMKQEIL